jgi:hemerythrin-like metal-binding protein
MKQPVSRIKYDEWVWSGQMVSGNESLDVRHRALFNIVNDIIKIYNDFDGEPSSLLVEVPLDELFKFAAHHFADEELTHRKFNFADIIPHHEMHIDFVIKLINLKIRFDREENISKELLDFLLEWRNQHIKIKDKEAMKVCK